MNCIIFPINAFSFFFFQPLDLVTQLTSTRLFSGQTPFNLFFGQTHAARHVNLAWINDPVLLIPWRYSLWQIVDGCTLWFIARHTFETINHFPSSSLASFQIFSRLLKKLVPEMDKMWLQWWLSMVCTEDVVSPICLCLCTEGPKALLYSSISAGGEFSQ